MTDVSFHAHRLLQTYTEFSRDAELGASTHLYKLQSLAWMCYRHERGDRKLVSFVISTVFGRLAQEAENGPVAVEAGRQAFVALDQHIKECLHFLTASAIGVDAAAVLAKVLAAYDQVKLAQSN